MRELLTTATAALIALGVVAAIVATGEDRTILVPPPEAVAEQFARQIVTGRYDRALQYVADDSAITEINTRLASEALQSSAGEVDTVEGEPGTIAR